MQIKLIAKELKKGPKRAALFYEIDQIVDEHWDDPDVAEHNG
jgi:hypothetical protein